MDTLTKRKLKREGDIMARARAEKARKRPSRHHRISTEIAESRANMDTRAAIIAVESTRSFVTRQRRSQQPRREGKRKDKQCNAERVRSLQEPAQLRPPSAGVSLLSLQDELEADSTSELDGQCEKQ